MQDVERLLHASAVAVLLPLALLLGACGGDDGPLTPGASVVTSEPPSTPTTPSDPTPGPTGTSPVEDLPVTPPGRVPRTITGTVEEGVEAGCRLVGDFLILGPLTRDLSGEVTLTGYPDPSMMTTCQQGTPFVVTEVVR